MPGKKVPFHGILTVGSTKEEALALYRDVALGRGAKAMASLSGDSGLSFVTSLSTEIEMFNPQTGDLDLEQKDELLKGLDFQKSESSNVEMHICQCSDGCGAYLAFDDPGLVQHCPACASDVDPEADVEDEPAPEPEPAADPEEDPEEDEGDEESESEESESESEDDGDDDDADLDGEDEDEVGEDGADEEGGPIVVASDSPSRALQMFRSQMSRRMVSVSGDNAEVDTEYVVCSSAECGAHILGTTEIHECPACLSAVEEPEVDLDRAIEAEEDADLDPEDDEEGDDEESESGCNKRSATAEDEGDETGEDLGVGDDDGDESEEDEGESEDAPESEPEDAPETEEPAASESSEVTDPAPAEAAPAAEAQPAAEPASEVPLEQTVVESSAFAAIAGDDKASALDFSFSSSIMGKPLWTAYHEGQPIAVCGVDDVKAENKALFADSKFGYLALNAARELGTVAALKELGFRPVVHQVSVSKKVDELVGAGVAEARAQLDAERKDYSERLVAALATSAIGITRGYFPNVQNPIKAALWDALSAAGVKQPEILIDKVFMAKADDYHRALFDKALDIIAKPLEVQESLSRTVLDFNYRAVASTEPKTSTAGDLGTVVQQSESSVNHQQVSTSSAGAPNIELAIATLGSLGRR